MTYGVLMAMPTGCARAAATQARTTKNLIGDSGGERMGDVLVVVVVVK